MAALQDQIKEVNVERVTESEKSVDTQKSEEVFYLPHSPVILESAESTKLRIVYDTSAKASKSTVPLNVLTLAHLVKIHFRYLSEISNETHHIVSRHTTSLLANLNQRT